MTRYKAILVDDEELARNRLKKLLGEVNSIDLIGEADNPFTCIEMIETLTPDLLFLDIQMPGLNGFELIQQIPPKILPLIIFVTAYDQFALRAFESLSVDYLLKPIKLAHIQKSVQKLKSLESAFSSPLRAQQPDRRSDNPLLDYTRRLVIKEGNKWAVLEEKDIVMFFTEDKYCFVRSNEMDRIVDFTLWEIEQKMNPALFMRIHRTTIIALNHVKYLKPLGSGRYEITLSDSSKVISSRSYSQNLKKSL